MPRKQKVPSRARLSILHLAAPPARFAVALFLVMNLFRPLAAQLPERRVVTGVIRLDTNNVLSIIVEETTAYAHKGSQIDVILNSSTEVDTVGYRRVAISGVRRYRRASVYFGVEGGHNIALKVTVYDPLDASTSQEASFQQAREGISRSGVTAQDIQFGRNTANSSVKLLNQYWEERFRDAGYKYVPPRFVFYLGATTTGCDPPGEVRGPEFAFYCPADRTVYYEESSMAVLAGSVAKTFASDAHDAVTLTLGHEWGHAIHHELESQPGIRKPTAKTLQIRFGRFENPNYSGPSIDVDATIASEREADCLAGAFSAEMMRASGLHGSTEWLNQIQDGGSEGNKECLLRAYTSYWGPDR